MMRGFAAATALALIVAAAWLVLLIFPAERAVRVRNAFLMRRGRLEDFDWTPATAPQGFKKERSKVPRNIEEAVSAAGVREQDKDWQRALRLVGMLVRHARHEGGIRADLATTFEGIIAGHGYCADYVRVYLAAAAEVGLFCRQWAFSFDGFGGHGHTFVEVYDRQRDAWAFLDVHNNVYAVLSGAEVPVDALGLRDALLRMPQSIEFRQAGPGRLGFPHFEKLLDYYRRGAEHWYLWWGNDVITREQGRMPRVLRLMSGRLSHAAGSMFGSLPLVVLATPENESDIYRMERLRRRVLGVAVLCAVLAAVLVGQVGWQIFNRRDA